MVNHLPIIFPVVGVVVMVTGLIFKSEAVKRTAFMIFALGALAAIAAMQTGEGAEDVVEKIEGITEDYIETHEETAETFALLSYVLGALSLLGLWASVAQKRFSSMLNASVLVFALVVLFFARQTGTTGGEIRHTEIRSGHTFPETDTKETEPDGEGQR